MNEAGRELLTVYTINDATVCNTWFQKKAIQKETYSTQNPSSGTASTTLLSDSHTTGSVWMPL